MKRLKLNRNLLRQRIGHSHRLLFRIDHETLTVLSVIDRRDLEKTIQSLIKSKEPKGKSLPFFGVPAGGVRANEERPF